jgi:hypothetical protein
MFQTGGLMLRKKLDAGWGVLPLAASLYVLTSVAPAVAQSTTGVGAPMPIQPVTQPQSGGSKVSDKPQSNGSKLLDKPQSNGPKVSDKKPTAPNAVVNLVNMLVKKGVLKEGRPGTRADQGSRRRNLRFATGHQGRQNQGR